MSRQYILGVDLGTVSGFGIVYCDGGSISYCKKFKSDFAERLVGLYAEIASHARPDCIGVVIEKPFGKFQGIDVMQGLFGVAVLACESNGLPWYPLNLMTSKKHMTGKGNAKKPDMIAACEKRFGVTATADEADALAAACYGLDNNLF